MYFDAVEEILNKLDEKKLKGSVRADLQRQLKELDPDGRIAKFVKEGGPRPDLTDIIDASEKNKKNR